MPAPRVRSSSPYLSRSRWTKKEAGQALTALKTSGQTLTAFAIAKGLDPQQLVRWRRILFHEDERERDRVRRVHALREVGSGRLQLHHEGADDFGGGRSSQGWHPRSLSR